MGKSDERQGLFLFLFFLPLRGIDGNSVESIDHGPSEIELKMNFRNGQDSEEYFLLPVIIPI